VEQAIEENVGSDETRPSTPLVANRLIEKVSKQLNTGMKSHHHESIILIISFEKEITNFYV
jgi:hypothetical protein